MATMTVQTAMAIQHALEQEAFAVVNNYPKPFGLEISVEDMDRYADQLETCLHRSMIAETTITHEGIALCVQLLDTVFKPWILTGNRSGDNLLWEPAK